MRYFPIFIDAQALQVLIVGAGEVAARKLELFEFYFISAR
jgi:uroporphyrin-III C-methyltransferase / precorrin-2 dehydrogenase / sirohydrochlorin ferrochelatase